MNPSSPFKPAQEFVDAQNQMQNTFTIFMVVFVLVVIFAIFKGIQNQANYNAARQDYLRNPNDPESKLRLIETASNRSNQHHDGGLDAIALMQATQSPVVVNAATPHRDLTTELERLAQLHAGGHLTDAEFDQAKAKLLS